MSSHAFRMDMGNLISVPAQSAPPSYTITHAHSFMFWRQFFKVPRGQKKTPLCFSKVKAKISLICQITNLPSIEQFKQYWNCQLFCEGKLWAQKLPCFYKLWIHPVSIWLWTHLIAQLSSYFLYNFLLLVYLVLLHYKYNVD